jgi:hypothetical protein
MAWWDARVIVFADKIDRGESWLLSDEEPEGDSLNDTTRLVIEGLARHAPGAAAEMALRMAEGADARVAELPLDRMAPPRPGQPERKYLVAAVLIAVTMVLSALGVTLLLRLGP